MANHYLSRWWLSLLTHICVTRSRWVTSPCAEITFLARPAVWILSWITLKSNELNITFSCTRVTIVRIHKALRNWLWRHHQKVNRASGTRSQCVKIAVLTSVMSCKYYMMYLISYLPVSSGRVVVRVQAFERGWLSATKQGQYLDGCPAKSAKCLVPLSLLSLSGLLRTVLMTGKWWYHPKR